MVIFLYLSRLKTCLWSQKLLITKVKVVKIEAESLQNPHLGCILGMFQKSGQSCLQYFILKQYYEIYS